MFIDAEAKSCLLLPSAGIVSLFLFAEGNDGIVVGEVAVTDGVALVVGVELDEDGFSSGPMPSNDNADL